MLQCWIDQLYEGNGPHDATNVPNSSELPYAFAELSQPNEKTTAMQTKTPTTEYVLYFHYIHVMVKFVYFL